ncbi:hypothetical protein [Nitrosomonas sp. Nm51]|nr:hypothetical protein [Nitrosomonas sp. Nm51]
MHFLLSRQRFSGAMAINIIIWQMPGKALQLTAIPLAFHSGR